MENVGHVGKSQALDNPWKNVSGYPEFFDEFKYLINKRNEKIVKCFLLAVKIQDHCKHSYLMSL